MGSLKESYAEVVGGLGGLIKRYGFVPRVVHSHCVRLTSEHCEIDLTSERYQYGFSMDFVDPKGPVRREYSLLYVLAIRCPRYQRELAYRYDDSLPESANLRRHLEALAGHLETYCADLLGGDFGRIEREGYWELEAYLDANTVRMMNMPADDPIGRKFWDGDLSWAGDLRARDARNGT